MRQAYPTRMAGPRPLPCWTSRSRPIWFNRTQSAAASKSTITAPRQAPTPALSRRSTTEPSAALPTIRWGYPTPTVPLPPSLLPISRNSSTCNRATKSSATCPSTTMAASTATAAALTRKFTRERSATSPITRRGSPTRTVQPRPSPSPISTSRQSSIRPTRSTTASASITTPKSAPASASMPCSTRKTSAAFSTA